MQRKWIFDLIFAALGGLMILFIVLPLFATFVSTTPTEFWNGLTDPEVINAVGLTFGAGAIATALALLSGIPLAYLLARREFPGKRLVESIVNLPVVIPHTAAGVALLLVFGRYGLVGKWLASMGIYFTDSLWGIVVAMLFVSLPFLVNISRDSFILVDEELERVALTDGASHWQAFTMITLPLAWRGIFSGALMMWARGISEFGAVVILAYHPKIVPVLVYERFTGFGLTAAQPVALLLILVALIVFFVLRLFFIRQSSDISGTT